MYLSLPPGVLKGKKSCRRVYEMSQLDPRKDHLVNLVK